MMIEKNPNPADSEWRQYPESHERNPKKHVAREGEQEG